MQNSPQVLIVDPNTESVEVLEAVLSRRGVDTISAGQADQGLQLARLREPNVIVLDIETLTEGGVVPSDFAAAIDEQTTRLVLLGNCRVDNTSRANASFLSKPYHYSALIRKIEGLLETSRAA